MSRQRLFRAGAVALLTMGAALACGSDVVSRTYKSGGSSTLPVTELHGSFLAPPDRALIGVHLAVEAPTFQDAAKAAREGIALLETTLSDAPGCAVRVLSYDRPAGRDRWHGSVELVVDADLTGLGTVAERMDRLDSCAGALAGRLVQDEDLAGGGTRSVTAVAPVITVDEPQRYLPELIAREAERLAGAHAATGAPQLHPEDLRCVPDGAVHVGHRLISGVQLSTTVTCRIEAPKPPEQG